MVAGGTTATNQTAAPDGNTTADAIVGTLGILGAYAIGQPFNVVNGTQYTMSCYLKSGAVNFGFLAYDDGVENHYVYANLSSGIFGTSNDVDGVGLRASGNGFYCLSMTFTAAATIGNSLLMGPASTDNNPLYTPPGGNDMFMWGAQVETGFPSSYIPNTGVGSTSRDQDEITCSVSMDNDSFDLFMEFQPWSDVTAAANRTLWLMDDGIGGANNTLALTQPGSNTYVMTLVDSAGGSKTYTWTISGAPIITDEIRIWFKKRGTAVQAHLQHDGLFSSVGVAAAEAGAGTNVWAFSPTEARFWAAAAQCAYKLIALEIS
jgi:hypothetical protein